MNEIVKGPLNPPLEVGDRVICYYMSGESAVTPGTKGVVRTVQNDPFESDAKIYQVNWDNGSNLALLSDMDKWKKIEKPPVNENRTKDRFYNLFKNNKDMFKYFDYKFFRDYILKIRDSGIVNMFEAYPLIYAGKEHLERYYGEGREEDEDFQELLDSADEAREKFIQGILNYIQEKDLDDFSDEKLNSWARTFAKSLLQLYIISLSK